MRNRRRDKAEISKPSLASIGIIIGHMHIRATREIAMLNNKW